jgi:cytochrome P450 family 6
MILELSLAILSILLLALYRQFRTSYEFWRERSVPFLEPTFPTGNMIEAVKTKQHFGYVMEDIYKQLKKRSDVVDYCGIFFFHKPVLLVMTPEFAKTILVRDFNSFADRGVYSNEEVDPLSGNLFFLEGHRWRFIRQKLAPTFTSGKLKNMFHTILDVGKRFIEHLMPYGERGEEIEIYDLLERFLTDVISSCAFGFELNSLKEPKSEFRSMGKRGLNLPKLKSLKVFIAMNFRKRARQLGVRFNDEDINDFFLNLVKETVDYRRSSGEKRKDFMQLLIDLMEKDDENGAKLSLKEVAAQAFVFFLAGEFWEFSYQSIIFIR